MGGVAKAVGNVVSDAVKTVGNAVEDVGKAIDDEIIRPVVKAVDNTIKAIEEDPLNAAIRIGAAAMFGPAGLAIANGTIALAQGESLTDAAKIAGKSYVIAQAGMQAGQAAGAAATSGGYGVYAANAASGAASGLTGATLSGGDAQTGLIMGGLGGLNKSLAQSISDQQLEDWSRGQAEQAYENSYAPTEQDVLAADPSIKMDFPLSTPTDATGPGYYNEMTGEYIPAEHGQYQAPLTDASGTNTLSDSTPMSETSPLNSYAGSGQPTEFTSPDTPYQSEGYDPLLSKGQIEKGLNFATNAIYRDMTAPDPQQPTARPNTQQMDAGIGSGTFGDSADVSKVNKLLAGTNLLGDSTGDPYELEKLKQLYGSITPDYQTADLNNQKKSPLIMAAGGTTSSPTSAYEDPYLQAKVGLSKPMIGGGTRKPFQMPALTQLKQHLAKGGLPEKYAAALPKGHKPEFITGLTGYYASGKGTGQSDDIDAMLHDGDYVADADLVAALGDGSSKAGAAALEKFRRQVPHQQHAQGGTAVAAKIADGEYVFPASFVTAIGAGDNKAGAKILDKMREAIREHKRSAPNNKIPPKAKSPLEYLKMAKG